MTESSEFCPVFDRPPVVQTRIGVQFSALNGLKSGHFGLLWQECLGLDGWRLLDDAPPLPTESEKFGDKRLRPPLSDEEIDAPLVRMRLGSRDDTRVIELQANRLRYLWTRGDGTRPSYSEIRLELEKLFERIEDFAATWDLGLPVANLWEVGYINIIPQGQLWQNPSDWSRILPSLFSPSGPVVSGLGWSTFSGDFYFDIQPQIGRVKVQVKKVVANRAGELGLYLEIAAQGEVGPPGAATWTEGVEIGHRSAVRVLYDLSSPEARREWGVRS